MTTERMVARVDIIPAHSCRTTRRPIHSAKKTKPIKVQLTLIARLIFDLPIHAEQASLRALIC